MKNTRNLLSVVPRVRQFRALATALLLVIILPTITFAGSATWEASPTSGYWNRAANWTPARVPNGSGDTATFAVSNTPNVALSANTKVESIVFSPGASSFTITVAHPGKSDFLQLEFDGVGVTNNSGIAQNFMTAANGSFLFQGHATAGNGNFVNTNNGARVGAGDEGATLFIDFSTAGDATFTNNGGVAFQSFQGLTEFLGHATAGNATFTNNGSQFSNGPPGFTAFISSASAGQSTIINHGGTFSGANGGLTFFDSDNISSPTAGKATLIAEGGENGGAGGTIQFYSGADGGNARVEVFGNGNLDISEVSKAMVTVGSIEGDGNVFLGSKNLAVGANNVDVRFNGVIQDGGLKAHATGGSLTKIGRGRLILRNHNTYTGGTRVKGGKLEIIHKSGSALGSGPVNVDNGNLGGRGAIAGPVTIGNGSNGEGVLSPGMNYRVKGGVLTIKSALTFNSDGAYHVQVDKFTARADRVNANGVIIDNAAQFVFGEIGNGTLAPGTVFTVIGNTAATPIDGTFANLPDGSTLTGNGNTYQASYEGGDGNDLTLTVQ